MNNGKPISKDEQWVEDYQKQTKRAEAWAIPIFLGCLFIMFFVFLVSRSDFNSIFFFSSKATLSLTDKAASLSLVGVEDYRSCVKDGIIFEDFIKEDTSIKDICVNQVYEKEHNLQPVNVDPQTVNVDPMTSFLSLIRNKPEYKETFIDCVSTKLSLAEDFLFNQAKSRRRKDEIKKELKWEVGQSCAKEIVTKDLLKRKSHE